MKGIIGIAFIVLLALTFFATSAGIAQTDSTDKKTVTVNGQYTMSLSPSKAEIYLGVDTQAVTAKESQQDNADIVDAVRKALYAKGLSSVDIETTSYSIYPVYDYPKSCDTCPYTAPRISGYKTNHLLKIKTTTIDKVGQYLDAAVGAGANDVSSIVFTITDEEKNSIYKQALTEAAKDAKSKADSIAAGLGAHITGIVSAAEGSTYIVPYYRTLAAGAESGASTQVSPGAIEVSASLSVVYEI